MELFSKRYNNKENFLDNNVKNRLIQEIKFIISSDEYIERFLLVYDGNDKQFYLEVDSLKDLSLREMGYSLTDVFDVRNIEFQSNSYDDLKLFDLLELFIIFCKNEKRKELIERFDKIFKEEAIQFVIHEWMFFNKSLTGVRSVVPFVKNKLLKEKLEEFYLYNMINPNYQVLSKITADLIQFIFSAESKTQTKKYSENLCNLVAKKWTEKNNVVGLSNLLNDTVKNAKLLSNEISNIRHTDQHTIPVDNPNFYKLVTYNCMSIVELVILSLPEKYITTQKAENIKSDYLKKYKVNKDIEWVIEESIKVEDIPF